MKIINALSGKVGNCVIGPKHYLNTNIKLGEVALCIARDQRSPKPCVWLIGGIELVIDYVSLARQKGEIEEDIANELLPRLDEAKKIKPDNAMARLASAFGMDVDELKEITQLAQVAVTAPVEGVKDFSNSTPKWLPKTANYAPSTH